MCICVCVCVGVGGYRWMCECVHIEMNKSCKCNAVHYCNVIHLSLSSSTDRYANVDVGVLLYHIERFPGIIILTTNLIDNLDKAFFRRLRYVLQMDIPPQRLRVKLWKVSIYIIYTCTIHASDSYPQVYIVTMYSSVQ